MFILKFACLLRNFKAKSERNMQVSMAKMCFDSDNKMHDKTVNTGEDNIDFMGINKYIPIHWSLYTSLILLSISRRT